MTWSDAYLATMRQKKLWVTALMVATFCLLLIGNVGAAEKEDFGDMFLGWVTTSAQKESLAYMQTEFEARATRTYVVGLDDIKALMESIEKRLANVSKALVASEESPILQNTTADAILVHQKASAMLYELTSLRRDVDQVERITRELRESPSRQTFDSLGLYNIGRAKLLEPFAGLGNSSAQTLVGKYSYGISYTSGNADNPGIHPGPSGDTVDLILTNTAGSGTPAAPYAAVAFAVYQLYKMWGNYQEQEEYEKWLEEQTAKYFKGLALLATLLPTQDEGFRIYSSEYEKQRVAFSANVDSTIVALSAHKAVWEDLSTVVGGKLLSAEKILTAESIRDVRAKFSSDSAFQKVYKELEIARTSEELGTMHDALGALYLRVGTPCKAADKAAALEDLIDAHTEAKFTYDVMRSDAAFAPIADLAARLAPYNDKMLQQTIPLLQRQLGKECTYRAPLRFRSKPVNLSARKGAKSKVGLSRRLSIDQVTLANDHPAVAASFYYCSLERSGSNFTCNHNVAPGKPGTFRSEFGSSRSPRDGIGGSAGNGGIDSAKEQSQSKVANAISGVSTRTAKLKAENRALAERLPEFRKGADEHFNASASRGKRSADDNRPVLSRIMTRDAEASKASRDFVVAFTRPSGEDAAAAFLANLGVDNVRLPKLPADQIVPGFPRISSLRVEERLADQGRASLVEKNINREGLKAALVFQEYEQAFATGNETSLPVTRERFNLIKRYADLSLLYAREITATNSDSRRLYGSAASIAAAQAYLEAATRGRLALMGLVPFDNRQPDAFPDSITSRRELTRTLEDFRTCSKRFPFDQDLFDKSPCNVFTSRVLERVYGITDFVRPVGSGSTNVLTNANGMAALLASGQVGGWESLGATSSQSNLDMAALRTSQGSACIAVWQSSTANAHGHIVVFLPGLPTDRPPKPAAIAPDKTADPQGFAAWQRADWAYKAWKDYWVPRVASFHLDKPGISAVNKLLSDALPGTGLRDKTLIYCKLHPH